MRRSIFILGLSLLLAGRAWAQAPIIDPNGQATNYGHTIPGSGVTSESIAINTTNAHDVIVLGIGTVRSGATPSVVTGVSGGGLTWHCRFGTDVSCPHSAPQIAGLCSDFPTCTELQEVWWACAAAPLVNQSFTANFSPAPFVGDLFIFAVSGAFDCNNPYDPNTSLPNSVAFIGNGSRTYTLPGSTTTLAKDFVYAFGQNESGRQLEVCTGGIGDWTQVIVVGDGGWVNLALTHKSYALPQPPFTIDFNGDPVSQPCPEIGLNTATILTLDAITASPVPTVAHPQVWINE